MVAGHLVNTGHQSESYDQDEWGTDDGSLFSSIHLAVPPHPVYIFKNCIREVTLETL